MRNSQQTMNRIVRVYGTDATIGLTATAVIDIEAPCYLRSAARFPGGFVVRELRQVGARRATRLATTAPRDLPNMSVRDTTSAVQQCTRSALTRRIRAFISTG